MRNIKLIIEYEGTNYHGFQTQDNPSLPTIQGKLEKALSKISKEDIKVYGSGRTDAGVHATGQVVNFKTNGTIPIDRVVDAVNSMLPSDIVALHAEETDKYFHSQISAVAKTYKYRILNRRIPSAFEQRYSYHIPWKLDLAAMVEGSKYIVGTHDFTAFKSSGSNVKNNVRTVKELLISADGPFINIEITADGFLYNMVRIIVGTLVLVGSGKIASTDIKVIIEKKDRSKAGLTAPPHGLCLKKVYY